MFCISKMSSRIVGCTRIQTENRRCTAWQSSQCRAFIRASDRYFREGTGSWIVTAQSSAYIIIADRRRNNVPHRSPINAAAPLLSPSLTNRSRMARIQGVETDVRFIDRFPFRFPLERAVRNTTFEERKRQFSVFFGAHSAIVIVDFAYSRKTDLLKTVHGPGGGMTVFKGRIFLV